MKRPSGSPVAAKPSPTTLATAKPSTSSRSGTAATRRRFSAAQSGTFRSDTRNAPPRGPNARSFSPTPPVRVASTRASSDAFARDASEDHVRLGDDGARADLLGRERLANDGLAARRIGVVRRARVDDDAGASRPLDGLRADDLGAALGHLLEHLVGELGQVHGVGHRARVGRVHAVDVAVDLAALGAERGGEGDRGRVGAAAAERRDLAPVAHPLVAGDDDHFAARKLVLDAMRPHLDDPRVEMAVVGEDPRLRSGERDRLVPAGVHRDREQRHRDPLAGREQHVELPARRLGALSERRRGLTRQGEERVGRLAHRADDDDDVVPGFASGGDAGRDLADLLDVGDARTAVLLNEHAHRAVPLPRRAASGQVSPRPKLQLSASPRSSS